MFFHCQIVQRAKDHKGEKVREGAIKTYFIRSREHLERVMPEIVLLCEHYKARAYINVAGKDFDALQKLMLVKLASDIHQGLIRNPRKCLNSAAGELKSRNPKWIVDIDNPEDEKLVIDWLNSAPHGAGRLMSRAKAKETLNMEDFVKSMEGIYTTSVCKETIDEAPMVYKPTQEIIECIKDTVEINCIIKLIYNFKAKEQGNKFKK